MGDGFRAVFGLPTAHENAAGMAVRAGLAILQAGHVIARELTENKALPALGRQRRFSLSGHVTVPILFSIQIKLDPRRLDDVMQHS